MAGLLGDGWDDPQSMATLSLAAGLLGPGGFGVGLGRGLQGYQASMANAADLSLRKQQILANQQEQQMRAIQMRQAEQKWQMAQQLFGGGDAASGAAAPSAPSNATIALAQGAQAGSVGPTSFNAQRMDSLPPQQPQQQAAPQSRLGGLTQDQIAGGVVAGVIPKELVDLWKDSKFGRALPPGWKQNLDGSMTYVPDPIKGVTMGPDGKTVQVMPGAADSQAALTAANKVAELRATNQNTPVPLDRLDRMPGLNPLATMDDLIQGGRVQQLSSLPPAQRVNVVRDSGGQGSFNGQPFSVAPQGGGQPAFKTAADIAAEKVAAEKSAAQPIDFRSEMLKTAHAQNAATFDKLSDTLRNEAEIQNRNAQLYPLLDKIQTGGFSPEGRIALANSLQTSGMVPDALKGTLAKWISNGDPTAGKVIENQLASAAVKTMLDTLDKEGKPNRAIFTALQDAQESVKSGNATLKKVFDLQKQLYDWHYEQHQKMSDAFAADDYNPLKFQGQFARIRNDSLTPSPAAAPGPQATMRFNPKTGKLETM